jgi:Fe-S cluster assembly ATP-binding protein
MINIENLKLEKDGKEILKGLTLKMKAGEIHAIMGPNGSGKSTLVKTLAGHPEYTPTEGTVTYEVNGQYENLLDMDPEVRAREGVFLGFQYPTEIPGVNNFAFLHLAFNAICKHQGAPEVTEDQFRKIVEKKAQNLDFKKNIFERNVNEGFSGGEKKKNEILQMAVLSPRLALLDETDSGLDIDALRVVASGVKSLMTEDKAVLLITHYQRLLELIEPDFIHVMVDGKIVRSGGKELAKELEKAGYNEFLT